jgi:hypothetical protein
MNIANLEFRDDLCTLEDSFIHLILTKYREYLWDTIKQTLCVNMDTIEKLTPVGYVGFLFNYESSSDAQICLKYYFLSDQKRYGKKALGHDNFDTLCNVRFVLPKRFPSEVESKVCAPLLQASVKGLGITYVHSWQDSFVEDKSYDQGVLEKEKKYFAGSVDMILLAAGNTVIFVHFTDSVYHCSGKLCSSLYERGWEKFASTLVGNKLELPHNLTKFKHTKSDISYIGHIVDFVQRKTKIPQELKDKLVRFPEKLRTLDWREFYEIPEMASHGFEHAENVANLLGAFYSNFDAAKQYLEREEIGTFCLALACWLHDFGLTMSARYLSGETVDSFYHQKEIHGKIVLLALKNALIKGTKESNEFLERLGFNGTNTLDKEILRVLAIMCGYHQKRAKLLETSEQGSLDNLDNPYENHIPSTVEINLPNRFNIDIPTLVGILSFLDASDYRCNRVDNINGRLIKIRDRFDEIINSCRMNCAQSNQNCFNNIQQAGENFNKLCDCFKVLADIDKIESIHTSFKRAISSKPLGKESCTKITLPKLLKLGEQPLHYGKHFIFVHVLFDEKGDIVFAPVLSITLKALQYFFETGSISVTRDLVEERDRIKDLLERKGIKLGKIRLFDPLKDKYIEYYGQRHGE